LKIVVLGKTSKEGITKITKTIKNIFKKTRVHLILLCANGSFSPQCKTGSSSIISLLQFFIVVPSLKKTTSPSSRSVLNF
jgi:hypothetical protein